MVFLAPPILARFPSRAGRCKRISYSFIVEKMFNIYMVIFIVFAVLVIAGGSYQLYGMQMGFSTLIFFGGSLYVFIVYGNRWFGPNGKFTNANPGSWPPIINTCPDYLTYYQRTKSNGQKEDTCIDLIGISNNNGLSKFDSTKGDSNPDNAFFSLKTVSTDASKQKAELCQKAITAGLYWEGITNGEGCVSSDGSITGKPSSGGSC